MTESEEQSMVDWPAENCRLQQGLQRHDETRKPLELEGCRAEEVRLGFPI